MRIAMRRSGMHTNKPTLRHFFFACSLLLPIANYSPAAAEPTPTNSTPFPLMTRAKEVELALSACPPNIAPKAGVYVLEAAGYVRARDSQNGFTAIVQHSLPNSQEPRCMDAEGTRTHLPKILKIAELRAHGKSRAEVERIVADALASGALQPPARFGIDYMLSTQNVVPVDPEHGTVAAFPPHVMFYAPYLTNSDIGSDGHSGPAFVAAEGTPYAIVIVPVGPHSMSHAAVKTSP